MAHCPAEGVLRVSGNPGGLFHFRKGVVVAVDSPGAPGAEALLLRSDRISEGDWTAALRDDHSQAADLVARGSIGFAELRVVALMALLDGAFAVAAGGVDGYEDEVSGDVPLPLADGVHPRDLLWETERRLDALDALPVLMSPFRERVVPGAVGDLFAGQREIVAQATGRRTARDIAFAVGRGVYPVTVNISRMLADGMLEIAPTNPKMTLSSRLESLRPRHAADQEPEAGIYETEGKHIGL